MKIHISCLPGFLRTYLNYITRPSPRLLNSATSPAAADKAGAVFRPWALPRGKGEKSGHSPAWGNFSTNNYMISSGRLAQDEMDRERC